MNNEEIYPLPFFEGLNLFTHFLCKSVSCMYSALLKKKIKYICNSISFINKVHAQYARISYGGAMPFPDAFPNFSFQGRPSALLLVITLRKKRLSLALFSRLRVFYTPRCVCVWIDKIGRGP
jgi:hypothetical protein